MEIEKEAIGAQLGLAEDEEILQPRTTWSEDSTQLNGRWMQLFSYIHSPSICGISSSNCGISGLW